MNIAIIFWYRHAYTMGIGKYGIINKNIKIILLYICIYIDYIYLAIIDLS